MGASLRLAARRKGWYWRSQNGRRFFVKPVQPSYADPLAQLGGQRPYIIQARKRFYVGFAVGDLSQAAGPFPTFEAAEAHWEVEVAAG